MGRARLAAWGCRVRRGVVAVGLGVVTSVGVAWWAGVAGALPPGRDYESFYDEGGTTRHRVSVATFEDAWVTVRRWQVMVAGEGSAPDDEASRRRVGEALRAVLPEAYRRSLIVRESLSRGRVSDGGTVWERRYGWPWRCVVARRGTFDPARVPPPYRHEWAIRFETPLLASWRGSETVILACRPLVAGLAGDAMVYGAGWLVVLAAGAAGVRALRRRRGRCPGCGYDLGGELAGGCPECGWGKGKGPNGKGQMAK